MYIERIQVKIRSEAQERQEGKALVEGKKRKAVLDPKINPCTN